MNSNKTSQKLSSNLLLSFLYRLSTFLMPLISTPYVSRVLGSESSGIYNYTYTIAQYFVLFGCYGFENYGNRQIARTKDDPEKLNKNFSSLYGLQLITSSIAVISYFVYLVMQQVEYPSYMYISGLYVISTVFNITWVFYGLEKFQYIATRSIAIKLTGLVLIIFLVKYPEDVGKYILILAALELVNQLVLWKYLFKYIRFVKVSFTDIAKHIKGCTLLFFPILLFSVYTLMDKSMLGKVSTMTETGYYSYAYKIVEIPFHFITAIGVVMLPRTTNLIANGLVEKSKSYIERTIKYNSFFGAAICFGLVSVSETLSIVFLGREYASCAVLIRIMAPMIIVRAWANVIRTQYLMPNSKDIPYVLSLVAGVVINFVLNTLMIPKYGAAGAAVATLFTESTVAVIQIIVPIHDLPILKYLKSSIPFLLFGIVMCIPVRGVYLWLGTTVVSLFVQILVGSGVYLLTSLTYLKVTKDPLLIEIQNKISKKHKI